MFLHEILKNFTKFSSKLLETMPRQRNLVCEYIESFHAKCERNFEFTFDSDLEISCLLGTLLYIHTTKVEFLMNLQDRKENLMKKTVRLSFFICEALCYIIVQKMNTTNNILLLLSSNWKLGISAQASIMWVCKTVLRT